MCVCVCVWVCERAHTKYSSRSKHFRNSNYTIDDAGPNVILFEKFLRFFLSRTLFVILVAIDVPSECVHNVWPLPFRFIRIQYWTTTAMGTKERKTLVESRTENTNNLDKSDSSHHRTWTLFCPVGLSLYLCLCVHGIRTQPIPSHTLIISSGARTEPVCTFVVCTRFGVCVRPSVVLCTHSTCTHRHTVQPRRTFHSMLSPKMSFRQVFYSLKLFNYLKRSVHHTTTDDEKHRQRYSVAMFANGIYIYIYSKLIISCSAKKTAAVSYCAMPHTVNVGKRV